MRTQTWTPTDRPSRPAERLVLAELRGATNRYGHVTAADSLDLEVRAGEFLAVLGPNGAGDQLMVLGALGALLDLEPDITVTGSAPDGAFCASR